jgi:hypothetical protein
VLRARKLQGSGSVDGRLGVGTGMTRLMEGQVPGCTGSRFSHQLARYATRCYHFRKRILTGRTFSGSLCPGDLGSYLSAALHPQMDGHCANALRQVQQLLKISINECNLQWEVWLPCI